jgi:hypothetical protein
MEGDSMRPRERRDSGQNDLFRARLDQIVDLNHPLAKLGRAIDWRFLEERFGAVHHSRGGQFIAHAKALPGNPYDGHTLEAVIPENETQIGASLSRIVGDRGYSGHNAPPHHRFKVYISGQKRRVTEYIKRELRRRSAIEPVIGHAKSEHRMGRNYLAGRTHANSDAIRPGIPI